MGLFIVAALSFDFGLILASVARLQLLILPSFWAVLGASFLSFFVAFYVLEKMNIIIKFAMTLNTICDV